MLHLGRWETHADSWAYFTNWLSETKPGERGISERSSRYLLYTWVRSSLSHTCSDPYGRRTAPHSHSRSLMSSLVRTGSLGTLTHTHTHDRRYQYQDALWCVCVVSALYSSALNVRITISWCLLLKGAENKYYKHGFCSTVAVYWLHTYRRYVIIT